METTCQEDAKSCDERYVGKMIFYNELSWTTDYEVIEDHDLYLVENLDPK